MADLTILDLMAASAWLRAPSWEPWRALLGALFALPLSEEQAAIYRACTGRTTPPSEQAREAFLIIGRRGGKSLIAALVALYAAVFRRYRLAPGERGIVMVIAADRRQARVVLRYLVGFIERSPRLADLVERRVNEAVHFRNGISIEVHTASFRTTRGYTVVGAICDEVAFWHSDDSANPDTEILAALRPSMLTVPGSLLLCISSPYARRGALWQAFKDHYAKDGDPIFVWRAATRVMNPAVPEDVIAEAYQRDEAAASAEYGAEFRRDIETFVAREVVEAAAVPERRELSPVLGVEYVGFVDPSGGSQDSMTLAVAHAEASGRVVLDLLRERRPPFSPEALVQEFVAALRPYRIATVTGDRYAGEWPREQFRKGGVEYEPAAQAKSEIYKSLLPLLNSRRIELLDEPRLLAQLVALERRTARGGRDSIDHAPGGHDDVVNAAAGALVLAADRESEAPRIWPLHVPSASARPEPTPEEVEELERREEQEIWKRDEAWGPWGR